MRWKGGTCQYDKVLAARRGERDDEQLARVVVPSPQLVEGDAKTNRPKALPVNKKKHPLKFPGNRRITAKATWCQKWQILAARQGLTGRVDGKGLADAISPLSHPRD